MKVIDLLVRIANGKEIPEKIKYENYIYWYDKDWKDYKNAQVEYRSYLISCRYHTTDFLNNEVEIIEDTPKEDKKIKKLEYYDNSIMWCLNGREITDNEKDIIDKINEIIDKINGE